MVAETAVVVACFLLAIAVIAIVVRRWRYARGERSPFGSYDACENPTILRPVPHHL